LGIQRIILKGDTLKIVYALQQEGYCWSWYDQLIDNIKTTTRLPSTLIGLRSSFCQPCSSACNQRVVVACEQGYEKKPVWQLTLFSFFLVSLKKV
jgi:hypothetical protein